MFNSFDNIDRLFEIDTIADDNELLIKVNELLALCLHVPDVITFEDAVLGTILTFIVDSIQTIIVIIIAFPVAIFFLESNFHPY